MTRILIAAFIILCATIGILFIDFRTDASIAYLLIILFALALVDVKWSKHDS